MPSARALAAVGWAGLLLAACQRSPFGEPVLPDPGGHLFNKGSYQVLYGWSGETQRLLYDADRDGVADVQTFYGPDGHPRHAEIDTDSDGIVDRWEYFGPGGVLERVAQSRRRTGRPDLWEDLSADGRVTRRAWDDDRDGRAERAAPVVPAP